jgi:hypothetical protein
MCRRRAEVADAVGHRFKEIAGLKADRFQSSLCDFGEAGVAREAKDRTACVGIPIRRSETDDVSEDSLEELKARRNEAQSAVVDVDETETAESFELPGADLSGEELSVRVIPKQADEFTCSSCFLVHHRSRLASEKNGVMICTDCAA